MTNHFHLVIETPKPNLIKVMHSLKLRYAKYFNKKHNRSGIFFDGKYKSHIVDRDSYLLESIRYVLLNPLRAGMVEKLSKYKWCSYKEYLRNGEITDTEDILGMFSKVKSKAKKDFVQHVAAGMEKNLKEWKDELYQDYVLGKDAFIHKVKGLFREKKYKKEIKVPKALDDRDYAKMLLKEVCKEYKIETEGLKGKRGNTNEARKIAMYLLSVKTGLSNKQIAEYFENVHYSTISQMRLRVERDDKLRKKAEKISAQVQK